MQTLLVVDVLILQFFSVPTCQQSPFFHLILGTFPLKHNLEFGCKN